MDKRKNKYLIPAAVFVFSSLFYPAAVSAGEDLKEPLLRLPRVEIVGKRQAESSFSIGDIRPEEFKMAQRKITGGQDSYGLINAAYGSFNSSLYEVIQNQRTENFFYNAQLNINDVGGERANSQFVTYAPMFKIGMFLDKDKEKIVNFKIDYFDKDMGLPGKDTAPTLNAKRRNQDFQISSQISRKLENSIIKFEPYYEISTLNEDNARQDYKNQVTGAKVSFDFADNIFDMDLYENRLEDYYSQMVLDSRVRFAPMAIIDNWQVRVGMNLFALEDFGQRPAPFMELIYKKNEKYSHKIKITREFQQMNFADLYLDANYVEVTAAKLRPRRETEISYQYDRYFTSNWRMSAICYVRQDKDYWYWNDSDNDGLYSPESMEKVNFGGGRISTEYDWNECFSNFVSIHVFKADSKDAGCEFVPYEPKERISLGFAYKITKRLKMNAVGEYFGRRHFNGISKDTLEGYFLVGSRFDYTLKDYLTLFVLVDNLLNESYEIVKGYENQERSVLTGMSVRF